jgi:acetylornithine deacetylase/succinyl-diaminopimelate desuccinylase-like protein
LHIEQGNFRKENIQIGVVEGIVGIEDWEVTVEGFANHAGTTPMNLRKDALLSAAKLIVAVNKSPVTMADKLGPLVKSQLRQEPIMLFQEK